LYLFDRRARRSGDRPDSSVAERSKGRKST
jgi:hypothetical protein